MDALKRVWVIGTGAVGSTLAALLHQAGHVQVTIVGQSSHWMAIREHGLRFETTGERPLHFQLPTTPMADLKDLDAHDLLLLTGKLPQLLARTAPALRGRIPAATSVIALQNGFGVEDLVGEALGRPIDRGLILFGAQSRNPGQVLYYPGRIRFKPSAATRALGELLAGANVQCQMIADYAAAEWAKLAVNCLANALAGLTGATNARISAPDLDPAKDAILSEVRAVARAAGVELDMTVADFNRYIGGATGGNVPSLWTDIARGIPTEIEYLNGAIVRMGTQHGVPTPVNALLTSVIQARAPEMPS